jgi:hypothetical protein
MSDILAGRVRHPKAGVMVSFGLERQGVPIPRIITTTDRIMEASMLAAHLMVVVSMEAEEIIEGWFSPCVSPNRRCSESLRVVTPAACAPATQLVRASLSLGRWALLDTLVVSTTGRCWDWSPVAWPVSPHRAKSEMTTTAIHALRKTRHDAVVCNPCVPRGGLLSLRR